MTACLHRPFRDRNARRERKGIKYVTMNMRSNENKTICFLFHNASYTPKTGIRKKVYRGPSGCGVNDLFAKVAPFVPDFCTFGAYKCIFAPPDTKFAKFWLCHGGGGWSSQQGKMQSVHTNYIVLGQVK